VLASAAATESARPTLPRPTAAGIKRVLLVLQSVAMGGMETHVVDLAAEYVRRGIVVRAIVPRWPMFDSLEDRFRDGGARVIRLDTDARGGRAAQVQCFARLLREISTFAPDVVHLHTPGSTGGLLVLIAARVASRASVVVTEHDVPNHRFTRWDGRARIAMDRLAHVLIAVSRRNASLRVQSLGRAPRRFAAVLNGVPIADALPAERAENRQRIRQQLSLPEDEVVIGSLVRLSEGKGLHDLLSAFAAVVAKHPAHLLLVGDGPLRAELESLAHTLGIADCVHFAGNQTRPVPFLDSMDVFVLAVPAGSMSIALLEAMARGLPPVITFCGPEEAVVSEHTGLCAPPNDPDGLGDVLLRITVDAELRERLGRSAAVHVRREFSVERVADDLLAIYASVRRANRVPARLRAA
jgi:glycosyltransferase involved in cell wall biosynthesis